MQFRIFVAFIAACALPGLARAGSQAGGPGPGSGASGPAAPPAAARRRLPPDQIRQIREQPWEAEAVRVGQGPTIDGAMDEPVWHPVR